MKIKIIYSLGHNGLEKKVNAFLEENDEKIEIIEIKWKAFLEHYAMIIYNKK